MVKNDLSCTVKKRYCVIATTSPFCVKSLFKYGVLSRGIMGKAPSDIKPVTDSWVSEDDGLCIRFKALTLSLCFFCSLNFTVSESLRENKHSKRHQYEAWPFIKPMPLQRPFLL